MKQQLDLAITCRRCGRTWPIPGEMSGDGLIGTAQRASHHDCVMDRIEETVAGLKKRERRRRRR